MGGIILDLVSLSRQDTKIGAFLSKLPQALLDTAHLQRLKEGQTLVYKDAPVAFAYLLLSGELITFSQTADGKQSSFITMTPPDMVSDLELLAGAQVYATNVAASADCVLLCFPAQDFARLLDSDPVFLREVARVCTYRTYRSSSYHSKIAFQPSLDMMALYLIQYCNLYGGNGERPAVLSKTRQVLAGETILSVKTVDRCLFQLRDGGYLSIVRGKVHISPRQYERLLSTWEKN